MTANADLVARIRIDVLTQLESDALAETQGFEPWIQVLARMLP